MPKFFVKNEQIQDNLIKIVGEDVNHISKVLRAKIEDEIVVGNADSGITYNCIINDITDKVVECKIVDELENSIESNVKLHILQGLPKADKMELIIQKSTELGVEQITPVSMERCVVKLDGKDADKKVARWQKIAEVAAKQSGRDIIPNINKVTKLKNMYDELNLDEYDLILVAYENEKENVLKSELLKIRDIQQPKIAVLIGPEGGIDIKEVELMRDRGAKVITLGNRILRTETVSLAITSMIMYELER